MTMTCRFLYAIHDRFWRRRRRKKRGRRKRKRRRRHHGRKRRWRRNNHGRCACWCWRFWNFCCSCRCCHPLCLRLRPRGHQDHSWLKGRRGLEGNPQKMEEKFEVWGGVLRPVFYESCTTFKGGGNKSRSGFDTCSRTREGEDTKWCSGSRRGTVPVTLCSSTSSFSSSTPPASPASRPHARTTAPLNCAPPPLRIALGTTGTVVTHPKPLNLKMLAKVLAALAPAV